MPEVFSATVAEREAELLALQSAFDEYIASSRELEEELDAELAKMRKYNNIVHWEMNAHGHVLILWMTERQWRHVCGHGHAIV